MMKRIRTKKNRKYRKKNKSFKIGGADVTNTNTNTNSSNNLDTNSSNNLDTNSNNNSVDELTQQIKTQHSLGNFLPTFNLGESKVLKKIVELSEGLTMKTIDNTAQYFNVDLNDSEQFKRRLEELKMVLNDPKNKVNGGILIDVDQLVKEGKVEGNFFDEVKKSLKIVNDENK